MLKKERLDKFHTWKNLKWSWPVWYGEHTVQLAAPVDNISSNGKKHKCYFFISTVSLKYSYHYLPLAVTKFQSAVFDKIQFKKSSLFLKKWFQYISLTIRSQITAKTHKKENDLIPISDHFFDSQQLSGIEFIFVRCHFRIVCEMNRRKLRRTCVWHTGNFKFPFVFQCIYFWNVNH